MWLDKTLMRSGDAAAGDLAGTYPNPTIGPSSAVGLQATKAWTPGNVAKGSAVSTTITVTGALMGWYAVASVDGVGTLLNGCMAPVAAVTADNTVTVWIFNPTATNPIAVNDGAALTLRVCAFKKTV